MMAPVSGYSVSAWPSISSVIAVSGHVNGELYFVQFMQPV